MHAIESIDLTHGLTKPKAFVVLKGGLPATDAEPKAFVKKTRRSKVSAIQLATAVWVER
jgi:hypothetical protein